MDNKFTEKIQKWLITPEKEKDYAAGAMLLLQLTNNHLLPYMANLSYPCQLV